MSAPALQLPPDWDRERDIVMLVGEGSRAMGQHFVNQGLKRVFVVCPPPLEPGPIPAGVALIRSEPELVRWLNNRPTPAKNVRILQTPDCSVPTEVTRRYAQVLQKVAQEQRDFLAPLFNMAPMWTKNGIRNFGHIADNLMIGDLQDSFRGMPLIIVGAGPSLEKNIDLLKEARGKAIILAVNRTLRSLQNAGVYPDFTMALEPRDVRCQFEGIALENIPGILLATTVDRNLFDLNARRFISYYNQLSLDGWMLTPADQTHDALSQGTVSHSAFSLGIRWGCDPIIFVGQDLSFPGGRYYHKDGADGETKAVYDEASKRWQLQDYSQDLSNTLQGKEENRFEGTMVRGYYGGEVPTSLDFAKYRTWLEQTASGVKGQCSLFNCTEGGAFIAGMDHKPLAEVLATLPNRDIDVEQLLNDPALVPNQQARQRRMYVHFDQMTNDLRTSVELSKQCLRLIDKTLKKPKMGGRLKTVEAEFKATAKRLPVLTLATQEAIKTMAANKGDIKTNQEALRMGKQLYTMLHQKASELHREAVAVQAEMAERKNRFLKNDG